MILRIENGSKRFGKNDLFDCFSCTFDFSKHSFYRVTGDSGRGKTTLLRILSSLEKLDRGEVEWILGEAARGGEQPRVSWMFQENRLLEGLSGIKNLSLIPSRYSFEEKKEFFAFLVGLENLDKPVSAYSGGMKRRLSFLRALIFDFSLLLLDEPFTGIDHENRVKMEEFLLFHIGKRPLIFVSHEDPILWKGYGVLKL